MNYQDVILNREKGWVEITINRPEKLNSLREQTADEILAILNEVEHDRDVRAVILLGSDKAFCTGIDTSEFRIEENGYFDFYRFRKRTRKVNRLFKDIGGFTKPLIAAIEGFALGGGLELALVGDIIVAGANARFGLPEIKLGMMPGGGGTQTLPRLIGKPLAKELMWTGRRITAAQQVKIQTEQHSIDDPHARCMPDTFVRLYGLPHMQKFIQAPGLLVMLYELNANYRQVFTDGRPLPDDPQPSWQGYSSGKWVGDTLIVNSIGFRDGLWLDWVGSPLTEAAKVQERIRRPDFGHLEVEVTVDDPKAYTKPWTVMLKQAIVLNTELVDEICLENEKSTKHMVGK